METANTPALLLLDLPPSAFAGIDLLSFTVTPRFRGVKNLPRGFHFAFTGTSTAFSERHGIWFRVEGKTASDGDLPLYIIRWNADTESLETETDEAERLRWRANLGSIWREGLTPYRQTTSASNAAEEDDADEEDESSDWSSLTSAITPELLSRITAGDSDHWQLTSASSARRDLEDIPGLDHHDPASPAAGQELHFLPVDLQQTWRPGAVGRERTEAAQDRSWALAHLAPDPMHLLGELQFCFLMLLTLNNFSCLAQWRRLLALLLTCRAAVPRHPRLFVRLLATLRRQLRLGRAAAADAGPLDLADDDGDGDAGRFLRPLLARFRAALRSLPPGPTTAVADVTAALDALEDFLRAECQWTLGGDFVRRGALELEDGERVEMDVEGAAGLGDEDETGEFAPVVVELTAAQARMLDVTPGDAGEVGRRLEKTGWGGGRVVGVVQDSDDDDEEEEEEEEMGDLEDMDARY